MSKRRSLIIVNFLIVFVLIAGIVIAANRNNNEYDDNSGGTVKELKVPDKFTITYSYGGGYGTLATTATRVITLDQDGNVSISLEKDEIDVEPVTFHVDKEKAAEVMKFFIDNHFEKVKENLDNNDVLDGDSNYLEVKSDSINRKVGGYAAFTNKNFEKFRTKFYEIVDSSKLKEFNKQVDDAFEKSISN